MNLQDGQILYASLANDGGWSLYVDGKKTELLPVADVLCGAKIDPGEHSIEFKYVPPGFMYGSVISLLSIATVALIEFLKRKKT